MTNLLFLCSASGTPLTPNPAFGNLLFFSQKNLISPMSRVDILKPALGGRKPKFMHKACFNLAMMVWVDGLYPHVCGTDTCRDCDLSHTGTLGQVFL